MMGLSWKEKTIKYGIYGGILLAAALLQNVGGLWPQIFGVRCFFLLPAAVLLSVGEDERAAAVMGFFAGVMWDMVSVHSVGFHCIYLCVVCFLSAYLVTFLFRNIFWYGVMASGVVTLLHAVLYWVLFVLLRGGDGSVGALFLFYLPSAIYTIVLTPVIYLAIYPLKTRLNKNALSEE